MVDGMEKVYNPRLVEAKIQKFWKDKKIFEFPGLSQYFLHASLFSQFPNSATGNEIWLSCATALVLYMKVATKNERVIINTGKILFLK